MMSDNNTGYRNTGGCNDGDWNTGDGNAGHHNTGHHNTGSSNAGSYNTGDCNTCHHNTGHRNTGRWNSGDWNTGDWNTGDWNTGNGNAGSYNTGGYNTGGNNTGNRNTGYHNAGNWNAADNHVGHFNTVDAEKIYCFNKLIDKSEWDNAYIPSWIYMPELTTWVSSIDMSDVEKEKHPSHETTGGYLRENDMKDQWRKAYEIASEEDIQAVRDLPAFDYDVFEKITGLDLRIAKSTPSCECHEIEIDGVVYVLKKKENE